VPAAPDRDADAGGAKRDSGYLRGGGRPLERDAELADGEDGVNEAGRDHQVEESRPAALPVHAPLVAEGADGPVREEDDPEGADHSPDHAVVQRHYFMSPERSV